MEALSFFYISSWEALIEIGDKFLAAVAYTHSNIVITERFLLILQSFPSTRAAIATCPRNSMMALLAQCEEITVGCMGTNGPYWSK